MKNIIADHESARKVAIELGLLSEEFDKIVEILGGRVPTYTELGIYSVMWSEHCSYKNSISELKKLPKKGKHLLVEAGEENAGLVDTEFPCHSKRRNKGNIVDNGAAHADVDLPAKGHQAFDIKPILFARQIHKRRDVRK